MKSYTDIEQSKKLAEILPTDTADGFYEAQFNPTTDKWEYILFTGNEWASEEVVIPCWSLAALLQIMPYRIENIFWLTLGKLAGNSGWYICYEEIDIDQSPEYYIAKSNLIDACYEMILKLHERNLL